VSWCDKLASTPTIGFKLTPHFAPVTTLLDALSPILDRTVKDDAQKFTLEQTTSEFAAGFNTEDGYKYVVDHAKVSVSFNHRIRYKNVSGGPPIMEMLSKPLPFTSLLPQVSEKLIEATLLLPEVKKRTINRVGIVSLTLISIEDMPPGIRRFIAYLGRPWKGALENFTVQISANLNKTSEVSEICIHQLVMPEDKDEKLLTIQFDWQRQFSSALQVRETELKRIVADAQKDALNYFEDLAEGSRFDEVLLHSPDA